MQGLQAYQAGIYAALDELKPLVDKYGSADSPLGREVARQLSTTFTEAQNHCRERLTSNLPKIMLYGVYNAGKSTLLNALIGQQAASVADKPETCKLTSYSWNGYELLDTPGIDAPVEHEKISREALTRCQVVLFVVSAARSFENTAIFEAMRDVAQQGKCLLIVLNDKDGCGRGNSGMIAVKQAIHRNLMAMGFSTEQAAAFHLCVVDAQLALDGRLEQDDSLVEESGIRELERLAVEEIQRVNGFAIAADLCGYLTTVFSFFAKELERIQDGESRLRRSDFLKIREEYADFCAELENRIRAECAPMAQSFMTCFPAVAELTSSSAGMDENRVREKLHKVWNNYAEAVSLLINTETERYRYRLAAQLQRILTTLPQQEGLPLAVPDTEILHSLRQPTALQRQDAVVQAEVVPADNDSLCEKVDAVSSVLSGSALAATVLKIPLPVIGPLSIPVGLVLTILPSVVRILFGKSRAERENERIEAEAAAQRRAAEEQARNIALWRQELSLHCQELTRQFLTMARKKVAETLEGSFTRQLDEAEEEILRRETSGRDILEDAARLQGILQRLALAKEAFCRPSDRA